MKIEYKTGDLFAGPEKALLHGCNNRGVMGSGVAKIVREKYPRAYEEYQNAFRLGGLRMGTVVEVDCGDKVVFNGITQDGYGKDGRRYVDYDAVEYVIHEVDTSCRYHGLDAVAMPLIGAGLGGGSWKIISEIIEKNSRMFKPVVYLLDGVIPDT